MSRFEELGLLPELSAGLKKQDIEMPTDIQEKAIPLALQNKDIIAQSETGSGKTLAYLLPLFQKVNISAREMQAIILAPTHELAIQILRQIEKLAENSSHKVTSTPIIGNVNMERQIEKLKEKPHIIVGSPGRILELIKKKKISAHTVKTIIIDEADRMMDNNNIDTVKAIVKSTLKERQLMSFSATIPPATEALAREMMKDPEVIRLESSQTIPEGIDHWYFETEQRDKLETLIKLVRILNPQKAIVFLNKSDELDITTSKLKFNQFKAEGIHGTSIKQDRQKALADFKAGKLQLLISSDLSARGLDIQDVTHVFNLDLPEDPKFYLHRVGRTGRTGKTGMAITIATTQEEPRLKKYEKAFGIKILKKDMYEGKVIEAGTKPKQHRPHPVHTAKPANVAKTAKRTTVKK